MSKDRNRCCGRRMSRRQFAQTTALAALAAAAAGSASAAGQDKLRIRTPFDGAVLNHRCGRQDKDGLTIRVEGDAPPGVEVRVNGRAAERKGDTFAASVTLTSDETTLEATSPALAGQRATARVVWDRRSFPRYRFSIDDNSFFLRDIAQKKPKSLWDCWYLDMLRELNRRYGVKFTVNIYYTTGEDFNLTQFPDRYKGQWRDCSGWLKLAFHARANDPDRPYQDAEPKVLIADLDQVAEQIHRFAGEASHAPPTVIHWGMTRHSAFKPLYDRGVRVLSGYFRKNAKGRYDVNYLWNDAVSEYLSCHDAWKDFDSGIVFSRVDIVCNSTAPEKVVPLLDPQLKDPNTAEIIDLFTHEQYFWPFYRNYLSDHRQRVENAIRWARENNFKPVFFHEGFLGVTA